MSSILNAGQATRAVTKKRHAPLIPPLNVAPLQVLRLLDQLREPIRYLRYSMRTEGMARRCLFSSLE
jgi:hypothetical protein